MALYVDGFVLPIAKKKMAAYRRIAKLAARIWKDHGALEYREAVGDDLKAAFGTPFHRLAGLRKGETAIFAWIVYKSRAHRDRINKSVMKDPRLQKLMDPKAMPFDSKRLSYGGFKIFVSA